jgi:hypothetical protein
MSQGVTAQTPTSAEAACGLVPLELPLFDGTPVADIATPGAGVTPTAAQLAPDAMQEVLDQYVACINTGNPTLVWAMFSPRWFSITFADPREHYLPAFEQMLTFPELAVDHPLELVQIGEITGLPDGRVDVTASFRSDDQEWTDTLTLVLVDGRWLIDDVRLDTAAD